MSRSLRATDLQYDHCTTATADTEQTFTHRLTQPVRAAADAATLR